MKKVVASIVANFLQQKPDVDGKHTALYGIVIYYDYRIFKDSILSTILKDMDLAFQPHSVAIVESNPLGTEYTFLIDSLGEITFKFFTGTNLEETSNKCLSYKFTGVVIVVPNLESLNEDNKRCIERIKIRAGRYPSRHTPVLTQTIEIKQGVDDDAS